MALRKEVNSLKFKEIFNPEQREKIEINMKVKSLSSLTPYLDPTDLVHHCSGAFIRKNKTRFKAFAEQFSNSGGIGNWSIPSKGYFSPRRDASKECGKLCKYEKRKSYGSDTHKRGVMYC